MKLGDLWDFCACSACAKARELNKPVPCDTWHCDEETPIRRAEQAMVGGISRRELVLMNGAED